MSVSMISHLMSDDDDDDTLNNLMTFCIQLLHYSQWRSGRWFMCGSGMEISLRHLINDYYHITDDMTDVGVMVYLTSSSAANCSVEYPDTYQGSIIRIYTDDVHTGYVKL